MLVLEMAAKAKKNSFVNADIYFYLVSMMWQTENVPIVAIITHRMQKCMIQIANTSNVYSIITSDVTE